MHLATSLQLNLALQDSQNISTTTTHPTNGGGVCGRGRGHGGRGRNIDVRGRGRD